MVNIFNDVLTELENDFKESFFWVDIRGQFPSDSQLDNEIHLKNKGYEVVADCFHEKIVTILGKTPTLYEVIV